MCQKPAEEDSDSDREVIHVKGAPTKIAEMLKLSIKCLNSPCGGLEFDIVITAKCKKCGSIIKIT